MTHQILVVEDDPDISNLLKLYLEANDYSILCVSDGESALEIFECEDISCIILDVMLPKRSGFDVVKKIRNKNSVPIIIISAKDQEADKILGLNLGADDYITKPFNPVEVAARVRSQLRRYMQLGGGNVRPEVLKVGGIELDDKEKLVMLDGEPVSLTPTEYDILKLLMQNPGQVFAPKEIYTKIWNDLPYGSENTVAVHIRHLREKLEINPAEPRYLKVVWGQGYKIDRGRQC